MARNANSAMLAALNTNYIRPAFLAILTFKSQTVYCWTGAGNITYNGHTYLGVGDFGKLGTITEATDVQAYSTSISLSGIDPNILSECLTDIELGAPATIYFALLDANGSMVGIPYPLFVGTVDAPTIETGLEAITISLTLENNLANLQRASMRRYTSADQMRQYPTDTGFKFVEMLNDLALKWTA
jgi:hypothetical protein